MNRAISPLRFDSEKDMAKDIVLLHAGWGKRPEMLRFILEALAEREFMPIAVDTRFGYANQQRRGSSLIGQRYKVGSENPFFHHASAWDNRYRLRRPTGVLAIAEALGIYQASLFGHSEGARIMAEVALSGKLQVPKFVAVNGVGIGCVQPIGSQLRSNVSANELFSGESFGLMREAVPSAVKSGIYAASHLRRWWRERDVIMRENLWPKLDEIALANGTAVTVMHAMGDMALGYEFAALSAQNRPHINFIPTEGGHSNVYTPEMTALIAGQIDKSSNS